MHAQANRPFHYHCMHVHTGDTTLTGQYDIVKSELKPSEEYKSVSTIQNNYSSLYRIINVY